MYHVQKNVKKAMKPLRQELEQYREQGIGLYINGLPGTPKSIARACTLAEGCGYMRDYAEDENGRIARVNFDLIKNT